MKTTLKIILYSLLLASAFRCNYRQDVANKSDEVPLNNNLEYVDKAYSEVTTLPNQQVTYSNSEKKKDLEKATQSVSKKSTKDASSETRILESSRHPYQKDSVALNNADILKLKVLVKDTQKVIKKY